MEYPDLFIPFLRPLNRLSVRYMITGAAAVVLFGLPRMTHDLDLVLELGSFQIDSFLLAFPESLFYRPPVETIQIEIARPLRGHFNLIHHESGFKADIFMMGKDPLHSWAMEERKEIKYLDESFWVAPPEYVIVRKLEYFREGGSEKHLDDIRSILNVSDDRIDRDILFEKMIGQGLKECWDRTGIRI